MRLHDRRSVAQAFAQIIAVTLLLNLVALVVAPASGADQVYLLMSDVGK